MIVLFIAIRLFKLSQIFSELVFFHQVTVYQQLKRVINGGTAYPVIPVFHVDIERLGVEVVVPLVNFFQNGETFGCFSQSGLFQLGGENFEYLLDNFLFVAMG
jgi:hypothetical protein